MFCTNTKKQKANTSQTLQKQLKRLLSAVCIRPLNHTNGLIDGVMHGNVFDFIEKSDNVTPKL